MTILLCTVSYYFEDINKNRDTLVFRVWSQGSPLNIDLLTTGAHALAVCIDAISSAKITRYELVIGMHDFSGLKTDATAESEVQRLGAFVFTTSLSKKNDTLANVPSIRYDKMTGNTINISDTDIAAFTHFVETPTDAFGITDGTYLYYLDGLAKAVKRWHKLRQQTRKAG